MPECTLCGKQVPTLNKIELEGAIIEVCDDCVKFGKVTETTIPRKSYRPMPKEVNLTGILAEGERIFVPDYGNRVRKAREARGLSQTEFARKINERESIIRRVERQMLEPSDALTRKIERFLNIKLKEEYE